MSQMMATGIESLDPVLNGGVPLGSVILLSGEPGAGNREFAQSSLLFINLLKNKAKESGAFGDDFEYQEVKDGHEDDNSLGVLPKEIAYVTFTRLSSSIITEMTNSYKPDLVTDIKDNIKFIDLSELYFESTVVPTSWYSKTSIIERFQNKSSAGSIYQNLAVRLGDVAKNSLIVLDSITDLATESTSSENWHELIGVLRGLQRIAKLWNSVIYILLSEGILSSPHLLEISDCCDAMIRFRWEDNAGRKRQRIMYFEKFSGVMPHLEDNNLVKYAVRITPDAGFDVSNIRIVI